MKAIAALEAEDAELLLRRVRDLLVNSGNASDAGCMVLQLEDLAAELRQRAVYACRQHEHPAYPIELMAQADAEDEPIFATASYCFGDGCERNHAREKGRHAKPATLGAVIDLAAAQHEAINKLIVNEQRDDLEELEAEAKLGTISEEDAARLPELRKWVALADAS